MEQRTLVVIGGLVLVCLAALAILSQAEGFAIGESDCSDPTDVGKKAYEANCGTGTGIGETGPNICCAKAGRVCTVRCGAGTQKYTDCMKGLCAGSKCKETLLCKDYKGGTS